MNDRKNDPAILIRKALDEARGEAERWQRTAEDLERVLMNLNAPAMTSRMAAAEALLRAAGRAMTMQQLIRGIEKAGMKVAYSSLYTNMVRQPHRFKRVGRAKWALVVDDR